MIKTTRNRDLEEKPTTLSPRISTTTKPPMSLNCTPISIIPRNRMQIGIKNEHVQERGLSVVVGCSFLAKCVRPKKIMQCNATSVFLSLPILFTQLNLLKTGKPQKSKTLHVWFDVRNSNRIYPYSDPGYPGPLVL